MSKLLNVEKEERLQPQRYHIAKGKILKLKLDIVEEDYPKSFAFIFKDEKISYFAYSGCATGKSINDCRGLDKLLKQLV